MENNSQNPEQQQQQPKYDEQPLTKKLAYDLQPVKLLTGVIKALIAIAIVVAITFGVGYWKGKATKPIMVDLKDFVAKVTCKYTGKEHIISVKGNRMYFDEKAVTAGDIPKLKPYGIEFHPKLFGFASLDGVGVGLGAQVAHFYDVNADAFLASDVSANVGLSYQLKTKGFENTSIGVSVGKKFKDNFDTTVKVYCGIKF